MTGGSLAALNSCSPSRSSAPSFRRLFLQALAQAYAKGELQFFGDLVPLADPTAFARYLAPLKFKKWVVYAKAPFGGPQHVLEYLGRYTHRVAISNRRLLALENGQVSFEWKDYRDANRLKVMTVPAEEFIRPLSPARCAARPATHPLLRFSGQLPPPGQTHAVSPTARHGLFPTAAPACRLPRLAGSTHPLQPPSLPTVWQSHPHPHAILPALSRSRSAPCGQLIIPSRPIPRSLRRCLFGRASHPCVHSPSHVPSAPNCTSDYLSESRFFRLPTTSSLPIHPLLSTKVPTHHFPQPYITALQTEQNPLKIDLPAKV